MLEKTKKALKEEIGKSSNLTCDWKLAPVIDVVKFAKALKDYVKPLLDGKKGEN